MKRLIITLICMLSVVMSLSAQDLIVKMDNTNIEAKVTEISAEQIRYKKWTNVDGPTYVLPIVDINYIQFVNGSKEVFNIKSAVESAPASVESDPVLESRIYEGARYEIGDFYSKDGVEGIVYLLDDSRLHGMLISMDEVFLPWTLFKKDDVRLVGTDNVISGEINMAILEKYIQANDLSWDDFPAFKWCRDKGEGWYLPAIDEVLNIGHGFNGGSRASFNRKFRNEFNGSAKNNGGEGLDRMVYYFSSTESNSKEAVCSHMAIEPPYVFNIPKHHKFLVRAVRKF